MEPIKHHERHKRWSRADILVIRLDLFLLLNNMAIILDDVPLLGHLDLTPDSHHQLTLRVWLRQLMAFSALFVSFDDDWVTHETGLKLGIIAKLLVDEIDDVWLDAILRA